MILCYNYYGDSMDSNLIIEKERVYIDQISDKYNYDDNLRHLLYIIIPAFIIKYGFKNEKLILNTFKDIQIINSDKEDKYIKAYYSSKIRVINGEYSTIKFMVIQNYNKISLVSLLDNLVHEYNHLLQSEGCEYNYLLEAWAELMSKEYYNTDIISYNEGVKNLMLLIDIIGPQPLFEMFYSNNNETLENILKYNLSNEDYKFLIDSFKESQLATNYLQENKEIRLVLCRLYENINKQSIYKDENILYKLIYEDNRIPSNEVKKSYINYRKMQDIDTIEFSDIDGQILTEFLNNNNISPNNYTYNNKKGVY